MRAHLFQLDIAWEDKPANHDRVRALIARTEIDPGDILVLPEMFDTGFSLDVERTCADPEKSSDFLRAIARDHRVVAVASLPVMGADGRARNRAHVIGADGSPIGIYDKVHPFTYGREAERFSGGELLSVFDVPMGASNTTVRLCPTVCYDLRFPELYRKGLDQGAEMFVVVANWPRERAEHWRALLIARAIENQAIVIGVNRTGADPNLAYIGGSIAVDPRGRVLGEAGSGEGVLSVSLEPGWVGRWREKFPAWRDRRIPMGPIQGGTRPTAETSKNRDSEGATRLTPADLRVSSRS